MLQLCWIEMIIFIPGLCGIKKRLLGKTNKKITLPLGCKNCKKKFLIKYFYLFIYFVKLIFQDVDGVRLFIH